MTDEELEIVKLIEQAAKNFYLENKLMMTTEFDNYQRYPAQFHLIRVVKPQTYTRHGFFYNIIGLYTKDEENYNWEVRFVRQHDDDHRNYYYIRSLECYDLYRLVSISPYLRKEQDEEDILIFVREVLDRMYLYEEKISYGIDTEFNTLTEKETCFIL
jgi:hypothetical protein